MTQGRCAELDSIASLLGQIEAAGKEVEAIQNQRAVALVMVVEKRLIEIIELMIHTIRHIHQEPSAPSPADSSNQGCCVMAVSVAGVDVTAQVREFCSPP